MRRERRREERIKRGKMEKRWREREGGQLPAMVANMRGVYCKVERGKQ